MRANPLDIQLLQRPPNLCWRQLCSVPASQFAASSLRQIDEQRRLVGIKAQWSSLRLQIALQQPHVLCGGIVPTKPARRRLVASSIMLIKYSFGPRPSSQSCSLVSHCTNSPQRLRRGRHVCTFSIRFGLARHSLASLIQPRSVSRPPFTPCFLARYSAASVGPNP